MTCEYPFEIDENSKNCVSFGLIENGFSNLSVEDIEDNIEIIVNRYYGIFGKVGVFYRIRSIEENNFFKMQNKKGIILFENGENTKIINIEIFKSFYLDEKREIKFLFEIFNPFGGCVVGNLDTTEIEIFENHEKNADLKYINRGLNIQNNYNSKNRLEKNTNTLYL